MIITILSAVVLIGISIWAYFYVYSSDETPVGLLNEAASPDEGNKPIWDWMEDRSSNMRDMGAKLDD